MLVRVIHTFRRVENDEEKSPRPFLLITFFCEKKVEFFFISKTVWARARSLCFSFEEYSAALSCTVRVTLFGGGRLVVLRVCFCVCVRFLFGEGEGVLLFLPSV